MRLRARRDRIWTGGSSFAKASTLAKATTDRPVSRLPSEWIRGEFVLKCLLLVMHQKFSHGSTRMDTEFRVSIQGLTD